MTLSKRCRAMIEQEWSEAYSGDGYWILLKPELQWDGVHVIHEASRTRAYRALKEVKPCYCGDCERTVHHT